MSEEQKNNVPLIGEIFVEGEAPPQYFQAFLQIQANAEGAADQAEAAAERAENSKQSAEADANRAEDAAVRAEKAANDTLNAAESVADKKPQDLKVTATFDTIVNDTISTGTADVSAFEIATAISKGATVTLIDDDNRVYKYDGYRLEPNYSNAFFEAQEIDANGITTYSATINNEGQASRTKYTHEYATSNNDPDRHAEYFTITDDGVVSLKPEYRGAASKADNINDVSDMGVGKVGSKNAELPKHLIIPEIVDGKVVISLAVAIFQYNDALENVTLPCTITELPKYCFSYCHYLKNVYNTENIKRIGLAAFQRADISRANFPKLEQFTGVAPFVQCRHLVYADLGKVAEIPQSAFDTCAKLNVVKSESAFTSVGKRGFFKTPNLKHADFSCVKSVGEVAFLRSGVDCDWAALTDCTFGANATPLQYSPTDYWSTCTFTSCENKLPTHLSQHDDRWGDRQIGTSGKTYGSNGCAFFTIMHIYCGLHNLSLSTVEEMEAVINGIDPDWLNGFSANTHDIGPQAEKLGLKYERFFTFDQANLQALYNALAAGKYGMVVYDEPNVSAHIVLVYGINAKGELLVADSAHAYWSDGEREPMKYALPIYKLCDQITMSNNYDLHIVSL